MSSSKKLALRIWKKIYGNRKLVKDFSGKYMYLYAYGKSNYSLVINGKDTPCGWDLDHILAKSKGGTSDENNLACTNIITNRDKADKSTFWTGDKRYQVIKRDNQYECKLA